MRSLWITLTSGHQTTVMTESDCKTNECAHHVGAGTGSKEQPPLNTAGQTYIISGSKSGFNLQQIKFPNTNFTASPVPRNTGIPRSKAVS